MLIFAASAFVTADPDGTVSGKSSTDVVLSDVSIFAVSAAVTAAPDGSDVAELSSDVVLNDVSNFVPSADVTADPDGIEVVLLTTVVVLNDVSNLSASPFSVAKHEGTWTLEWSSSPTTTGILVLMLAIWVVWAATVPSSVVVLVVSAVMEFSAAVRS